MDNAKIYNVCLQRVKFQIDNAKRRLNGSVPPGGRVILESYNSGDLDEIVDILEIYDLEELTGECLRERLDDLAYTVSVLVNDKVCFDYDSNGDLCLYFIVKGSPQDYSTEAETTFAVTS